VQPERSSFLLRQWQCGLGLKRIHIFDTSDER
jgi:hypothetical protein